MDAMDILGDLLGHKSKKSGRGTDILKDIFGRGSKRTSGRSSNSESKRPIDINRDAEALEELLNVANGRSSSRHADASGTQSRQPMSFPQPSAPQKQSTGFESASQRNSKADNEHAIVLIKAMVNASKADGKIDADEQKKILEQLGGRSREQIDFVRKLLAEPLDIDAFARSVPFGMEQQVYSISLIAIDLDENREADYLRELAQYLRIAPEVRQQIHRRLGAPQIF